MKGEEVKTPRFSICRKKRRYGVLKTILLTILVFGVIITLHELGHFIAARLFGVRVNEFSYGMGPKLFSWKGKETQYSIRLLPIGGYVAMEGEDEESIDGRAFCNKAPWKRFIIVFAGAFMNMILGLVLLAAVISRMEYLPLNIIADFDEGAVSSQVLQSGDRILEVNGCRTPSYNDAVFQILRDEDGVLDLTVRRGADLHLNGWQRFLGVLGLSDMEQGELVTIEDLTLQTEILSDGTRMVNIDFNFYVTQNTFLKGLRYAFTWTGSMMRQVWYSLLDIIGGRYGLSEISGPVGTATVIQEASSMGIRTFLMMFSLITVNVGIFNLLPIPGLDGGRLFFLLIEIIRRKPVPARFEALVHGIGLVLLLGLVALVTFSDIMKLIRG